MAMTNRKFPSLDAEVFGPTRDALHAYSRILGDWAKTCRSRRKHWWHASLRPTLTGLTTGVIHSDTDFEIGLNIRDSALTVKTAIGEQLWEGLSGQPAEELADRVRRFLASVGVSDCAPKVPTEEASLRSVFNGYSTEEANKLARTLSGVSAELETFRAGIREETSPIQLWPHHFDLAMLWLPGDKIAGQDPNDEEYADQQMNFGFTFGDDGIPEPYFYVTAYPLPDALPTYELPAGTQWQTEGFSGAVLLYQSLRQESDPGAYLQALWSGILEDGKRHLIAHSR